jgi:hypothetical protein
MFPAIDAAGRQAALDDNRRAIDEAKTLDAACLVPVAGGLLASPFRYRAHRATLPARASRCKRRHRRRSTPSTRAAGMPLAIEPLHLMRRRRPRLHFTPEQARSIFW